MLDKMEVSSVPQGDEPFDGFGEFAVITVAPIRAYCGNDGRVPVMPLLSRGHHFDDTSGDTWTVLRAHVRWTEASVGDSIDHYWYEYFAVAGRHTLY